jgi:hypothetical protein
MSVYQHTIYEKSDHGWWFTRSKWNMYLNLLFLAWKWWWKVVYKKYFWNSCTRKPFSSNSFYCIERRPFLQNHKFSNKNYLLCAWRDFKKEILWYMYFSKWNFKLKISSIFHFDRVNHGRISHILCATVNKLIFMKKNLKINRFRISFWHLIMNKIYTLKMLWC